MMCSAFSTSHPYTTLNESIYDVNIEPNVTIETFLLPPARMAHGPIGRCTPLKTYRMWRLRLSINMDSGYEVDEQFEVATIYVMKLTYPTHHLPVLNLQNQKCTLHLRFEAQRH